MLTAALLAGSCSMEDLLGPTDDATSTDASKRPSSERCGSILTTSADTTPLSSVTVLLADGSASGFARNGATHRQDWAAALADRLPNNGTDLVAMGVFGGAVDWKFTKVTPGKSNDPHRTENDLKDARACLSGDLSDAVQDAAPTKPQTDVLRALAEGAEYVRNQAGAKNIYLATDGLSNTGCADLRAASVGDHTAIPRLVKECEPELPKLGKDFTVTFLGIGNPAEGWSDVKTPQRTWLVKLWKALCDATGATCGEPTSAKPASVPATAIGLPADADASMPEIVIDRGSPTVLTVPASLLFDVDSHELASGRAQEAMQQVFDFMKSVRYSRVEVAGHTDSTGTPDHNRKLSQRRADTVAATLRGERFTNIKPVGYASNRPACTPEYKDGRPDRIAMACNRRVEIIIYT